MTEVQNVEIVETPKVEVPVDERDFWIATGVKFESDSGTWHRKPFDWTWEGPEDAEGEAITNGAIPGSIRVYRLGPPKPRMGEEEVRKIVKSFLHGRPLPLEAGIAGIQIDTEAYECDFIDFARRLGVLEQPS